MILREACILSRGILTSDERVNISLKEDIKQFRTSTNELYFREKNPSNLVTSV
jgi:hypothetical protein